MTATLWVGPFYEKTYKTGDRAFLVRKCHKTRGGVSHYELRDTPPRTDQSFEWRLEWVVRHSQRPRHIRRGHDRGYQGARQRPPASPSPRWH